MSKVRLMSGGNGNEQLFNIANMQRLAADGMWNRVHKSRTQALFEAAFKLISTNDDVANAFFEYEQADANYKKPHALKHDDDSQFASSN